MLQDAVRLALTGTSGNAPKIELQCTPSASSAFVDRVQIEQVAFNLIRNAIEAMENSDRPALTITASLNSASMVEVSVSDTGRGLSPDIRARLFEPFITDKPSGLGIGLSICRVIVEAHGGQLEADNNPGGGAVFRFTLPQTSMLGSEERATASA
jgi:two-component system, LuxR family, sensor kinase FixL